MLPASAALGRLVAAAHAGEAGVRVGNQIRNDPTRLGWIAYGPFKYLEEGRYLVSDGHRNVRRRTRIDQEMNHAYSSRSVAGPELLGIHSLRRSELETSNHRFTFVVVGRLPRELPALKHVSACSARSVSSIQALTVEPAPASIIADNKVTAALTIADLLRVDDWLPFLRCWTARPRG